MSYSRRQQADIKKSFVAERSYNLTLSCLLTQETLEWQLSPTHLALCVDSSGVKRTTTATIIDAAALRREPWKAPETSQHVAQNNRTRRTDGQGEEWRRFGSEVSTATSATLSRRRQASEWRRDAAARNQPRKSAVKLLWGRHALTVAASAFWCWIRESIHATFCSHLCCSRGSQWLARVSQGNIGLFYKLHLRPGFENIMTFSNIWKYQKWQN